MDVVANETAFGIYFEQQIGHGIQYGLQLIARRFGGFIGSF
jgi:hypothetical protein